MLKPTRAQRKQLAIENAGFPDACISIPRERWAAKSWNETKRIEVWRSKKFLVQVFAAENGGQRVTISTTTPVGHTWQAGITWDDIQRLKAEIGRADEWAVEVYPTDSEIVNVANMRHIWLVKQPEFAWFRAKESDNGK